jgi:hypothetical protein
MGSMGGLFLCSNTVVSLTYYERHHIQLPASSFAGRDPPINMPVKPYRYS